MEDIIGDGTLTTTMPVKSWMIPLALTSASLPVLNERVTYEFPFRVQLQQFSVVESCNHLDVQTSITHGLSDKIRFHSILPA